MHVRGEACAGGLGARLPLSPRPGLSPRLLLRFDPFRGFAAGGKKGPLARSARSNATPAAPFYCSVTLPWTGFASYRKSPSPLCALLRLRSSCSLLLSCGPDSEDPHFAGLTVSSADDPRVTGRFGAHASSCLRGFRSSRRSAFSVSSSTSLRLVSASGGTSGVSCCFLRVSARARAPMLSFPLSPQRDGASRQCSSAASTPRSSSHARGRSWTRS